MPKFKKEQIEKFWIKYFPEIEIDELNNILKFAGQYSFSELCNKYDNYDEVDYEHDIEKYVDFNIDTLVRKACENLELDDIFTPFILPIVNYQYKNGVKQTDRSKLISDSENFWINILSGCCEEVYQGVYKTVIHEFQYNKKNGKSLKEYIDICQKDIKKIQSYYKEYIEITTFLSKRIEMRIKYVYQILDDILFHKEELEKKMDIYIQEKSILNIFLGDGDTHQGGKSVARIELRDGKNFYYKPHPLKMDEKFSELICWLYEMGAVQYDYKYATIISDEQYGFAEKIKYIPCTSMEKVKNFYGRCGELLCILYSLGTVDIHYENIIACGEYPILIDLETLLHPRITGKLQQNQNSSLQIATDMFESSVVTVGMLPTYLMGKLEVGGLGANEIQQTDVKTEFIVKEDNNIYIERKNFKLEVEKNNPIINGKRTDATEFQEEIKKSFSYVYKWILENKQKYIKKIYDLFIGIRGRVVVRPTYLYSQLLNISLHQEFARKKFERDIILYRILIEQYKKNPEVAKNEYMDLQIGDVPYFSFVVGENKIYSSTGKEIENSGVKNVIEIVKNKVLNFSEDDLNKQLSYINDSFITRANKSEKTNLKFEVKNNILTPEAWLKTAIEIGDYILENMIVGKNDFNREDASWICVTLQGFEEDVWIPSVLSSEFYSGNAGIALFYLYLWKITGEKRFYTAMIMAAEIPVSLLKNEETFRISPLGAFCGVGGTLYLLDSMAYELKEEKYRKIAETILYKCNKLIEKDKNYDIVGGTAGLMAVALKMAKNSNNLSQINKTIKNCIEHLKTNAIYNDERQAFWNVSRNNYSGFAHGNAGIHSYLYMAGKHLNDQSVFKLVDLSLCGEQKFYIPKQKNWSRSQKEQKVSYAWCHGVSGILLSKLLLYREGYKDINIKEQIENAIKTTILQGFGNNVTYCHGDLGNLDILKFAGNILGKFELVDIERQTFQELYSNILSKQWRNKEFKSCNTFGLLIGLAGWGYSMLSHYAEKEVPHFLWIE